MLMQVRSSLLQACIEAGDVSLAISTCAALVSSYRAIYPANHPLLGLQLYTLGNLQLDALASEQAALEGESSKHNADESPSMSVTDRAEAAQEDFGEAREAQGERRQIDNALALSVLQEALEILVTTHGPGSNMVESLKLLIAGATSQQESLK